MGYATVMNVPRIMNHRHAKQVYEVVKPIRGRSPEVRPLGNRRDADTYQIRMNGDDVELVLYKTPVVTFKPDNTVELRTAGWSTVSTRQFISRVLGIGTHGEIGESIVTIGGRKHILPSGNECMTVRMNDKDQWCLTSAVQTHFDWKLNRKAANNVRARYAKFIGYLDVIMRLRKDVEDGGIDVAYAEYAEAFGEQEKKNYWGNDTYKRGGQWVRDDITYEEATNAFFKLITSGAHDDFYKASLILFATAGGGQMNIVSGRVVRTLESRVDDRLNEVLYKYHSDEVFDKVEMPEGKLPKGKYKNWVNKE
jgi:hypothetical protein